MNNSLSTKFRQEMVLESDQLPQKLRPVYPAVVQGPIYESVQVTVHQSNESIQSPT
jgi:hypothetical protein